MSDQCIILGIDPGTQIMGFAAVQTQKQTQKLLLLDELILPKTLTYQLKLKKIFEHTLYLIDQINPDEVSIEAPFMGKNAQSMLKLGRAQGVAMAAALSREIPITEYAPKKIKMAVTGNGNASKEQVARMLQQQFKIKELPKNLDSMDALAAAMCHFYNRNSLVSGSKKSGSSWSSFVNNNPDRIK